MTSLDPHYDLPLHQGLWKAFESDPHQPIPKLFNTIGQDSTVRSRVDLPAITKENLNVERAEERHKDMQKKEKEVVDDSLPMNEVLDKLRWASIGLKYHVCPSFHQLGSHADMLIQVGDEII